MQDNPHAEEGLSFQGNLVAAAEVATVEVGPYLPNTFCLVFRSKAQALPVGSAIEVNDEKCSLRSMQPITICWSEEALAYLIYATNAELCE